MKLDDVATAFMFTDSTTLSHYSADEVAEQLTSTLDSFDAAYPPDYDRPMYLGVALARASHHEQDELAVRWLSERPSDHRLRIVSALLSGLWIDAYREKPIRGRDVEELIRIRRRLLEEGASRYDAGLPALGEAFEGKAASHEVKVRIAEVLREAQRAPDAPHGFAENVQKTLEKKGFG